MAVLGDYVDAMQTFHQQNIFQILTSTSTNTFAIINIFAQIVKGDIFLCDG